MKNKGILVKLSEEDKAFIERAASTENLGVSTYLRKLALDDAKAKGFKKVGKHV